MTSIRRRFRLLPATLTTGGCVVLAAALGQCPAAGARSADGGRAFAVAGPRDRRASDGGRHDPARASRPDVSAADSAAIRRAADLVRRARDAERAATLPRAGTTPNATPAAVPVLDATLADSARRGYLAAAALVPEIADWLRLRAAGVTREAGDRAAMLRTVTLAAARVRAPLTDALARARTGDPGGAAAALDSLGRPAQALALRLAAADDAGARRTVRAAALDLLRTGTPAASVAIGVAELPRERVRGAAALLDSAFASDPVAPLTPAERVEVARTLADARDPATLRRAAAGFVAGRAGGGELAPADAVVEAGVLARLGQWRDAAAAYARVQGAPAPLGPAAAYERGRALLRAGDGAGARAALRALATASPTDTAAAAARFLLAELTADDGRDTEARTEYARVAHDFPAARLAPVARFRAGVIALAAGDARGAAAEFDAVGRAGDTAGRRSAVDTLPSAGAPDATSPNATSPDVTSPNAGSANGRSSSVGAAGVATPDVARDAGPDAVAAAYWAGRAWAAAGDTAQARARWETVLARDPVSYYGWRAAVRLGRPWTPTVSGPAAVPVDPAADAAGRRAALLERVGLTPEAGYERDALIRAAGDVPDRMLAAARALELGPRPGAGIRLAARAVERGAPRTAAVWQLLDPLRYADALRASAAAAGVDPALAAGVIRQESSFTPDAVSPVGARGLMQLMPDVGRGLWRGEGNATWTPDLLFVPGVNLALGMRHLAAGLRGYPDPAYALAAYNAGGARVTRWRQQPGTADAELFVERIPYAETRDYVRLVLRNRELYRALYRL